MVIKGYSEEPKSTVGFPKSKSSTRPTITPKAMMHLNSGVIRRVKDISKMTDGVITIVRIERFFQKKSDFVRRKIEKGAGNITRFVKNVRDRVRGFFQERLKNTFLKKYFKVSHPISSEELPVDPQSVSKAARLLGKLASVQKENPKTLLIDQPCAKIVDRVAILYSDHSVKQIGGPPVRVREKRGLGADVYHFEEVQALFKQFEEEFVAQNGSPSLQVSVAAETYELGEKILFGESEPLEVNKIHDPLPLIIAAPLDPIEEPEVEKEGFIRALNGEVLQGVIQCKYRQYQLSFEAKDCSDIGKKTEMNDEIKSLNGQVDFLLSQCSKDEKNSVLLFLKGWELRNTEKSYQRNIDALLIFVEQMAFSESNKPLLRKFIKEIELLKKLSGFSHRILDELEINIDAEEINAKGFLDLFSSVMMKEYFATLVQYGESLNSLNMKLLEELSGTEEGKRFIVENNISTFLDITIMPVQRGPRYQMLLEEISKLCSDKRVSDEYLILAVSSIKVHLDFLNVGGAKGIMGSIISKVVTAIEKPSAKAGDQLSKEADQHYEMILNSDLSRAKKNEMLKVMDVVYGAVTDLQIFGEDFDQDKIESTYLSLLKKLNGVPFSEEVKDRYFAKAINQVREKIHFDEDKVIKWMMSGLKVASENPDKRVGRLLAQEVEGYYKTLVKYVDMISDKKQVQELLDRMYCAATAVANGVKPPKLSVKQREWFISISEIIQEYSKNPVPDDKGGLTAKDLLKVTNALVSSVVEDILLPLDMDKMKSHYKEFVELADIFEKQGEYLVAAALLTAIRDPRIQFIRGSMDSKTRKVLKGLEKSFDPTKKRRSSFVLPFHSRAEVSNGF